jgi:outer membrane protein TolC
MNLIKAILALLTISLFHISVSAQENAEAYLDSLKAKATGSSPGIKMLNARLEAVKNKIPQNSNLPDPVLTLGLVNMPTGSFSFDQDPMTSKMVGLSQKFPFPGKLSSVESLNAIDSNVVIFEIEEERNKIKRNVEEAYWELIYLAKVEKITNDKKDLLKNIFGVVSTKYMVSEASQHNLFNVQLSLSRLDEKLEDITWRKKTAQNTLQALISTGEKIIVHQTLLDSVSLSPADYSELENTAMDRRPLFRKISAYHQKAGLLEETAEYDYYPDFSLALQYNQRENTQGINRDLDDLVSIRLGMNLPLNYGGKRSAKIDEAISYKYYYDQMLESEKQYFRIAAEESLNRISSLIERERLLNDLTMLQAKLNYSAALAGYQVGDVDFVNVIEAVNQMLETELDIYRIRKEYLIEQSKLSFLAGTDIGSIYEK